MPEEYQAYVFLMYWMCPRNTGLYMRGRLCSSDMFLRPSHWILSGDNFKNVMDNQVFCEGVIVLYGGGTGTSVNGNIHARVRDRACVRVRFGVRARSHARVRLS